MEKRKYNAAELKILAQCEGEKNWEDLVVDNESPEATLGEICQTIAVCLKHNPYEFRAEILAMFDLGNWILFELANKKDVIPIAVEFYRLQRAVLELFEKEVNNNMEDKE